MGKICLISQTVFVLLILQNFPALYGAGTGADPEGSTGCSKTSVSPNFSNGQGRCWRYCQGTSGPWCYTCNDCISQEEKCAKETTCSNNGCLGSSEGCVDNCPAISSTHGTSGKIAEPVGSTGCSKKWSGGYCWRFCKGSFGEWCYTRKGCLGDEESCAYDDKCGARSCEGAAPGCVLKCSDEQTQCLQFIKRMQGNSTFFSLQISADSRVLSKDPEIRPYIEVDESRGRKKLSCLKCSNIPTVNYSVVQLFEMLIDDLDLDPNVLQESPQDPNNPIVVVFGRPIQYGNRLGQMPTRLDENGKIVLRPEMLVAEILPRHLNPNNRNNFPESATNYMRNNLDAQDGDVVFPLVPNDFGGPPQPYNMVPGHPSLSTNVDTAKDRQRNDWSSVDRAMRDHLQAGSANLVRWYVGLYYDDMESGRPTHLAYMAVLLSGAGNRNILFGASENRQI